MARFCHPFLVCVMYIYVCACACISVNAYESVCIHVHVCRVWDSGFFLEVIITLRNAILQEFHYHDIQN